MAKDDCVYLGHMLETAQRVERRVRGLRRFDFDANEDLRLALTHLLQIIGEAARRVSPEFRSGHPELPWRAIVGMRTKVVHDYLDVDEDVVWDTATREIQPLIGHLERLVSAGPEDR